MNYYNAEEHIGKRFGRLIVLGRGEKRNSGVTALCKCDCGVEKSVLVRQLLEGRVVSCGCLRKERLANGFTAKHGMARTRLYNIWKSVKKRTCSPNNKDYPMYGAKGVLLCEEWQSFEPFRDWALANGYTDELSIERKDVHGNYEPSNCEWITMREQQRNKRLLAGNKTGVTGVILFKSTNKYRADITVDGKRIYLGYYDTIDEAKQARLQAELKYWGAEYHNKIEKV